LQQVKDDFLDVHVGTAVEVGIVVLDSLAAFVHLNIKINANSSQMQAKQNMADDTAGSIPAASKKGIIVVQCTCSKLLLLTGL
jgi:hypothetical protein